VLIDRSHRGWALASLALTAVATAAYVLYVRSRPYGASGGSWPGLAYGVVGTTCMIAAGLLAGRKKVRTWRLGPARAWMQLHIWLGLLAVPLILFHSGFSLGGWYVEASAMFCDIRSFTTIAEGREPTETIELLNDYYTLMMDAIGSQGGVVNQIVGDGLMAIFGAPVAAPDFRLRAVRAGRQMIELIDLFNRDQASLRRVQITIGIGIASGRVIAGYTGTQHRATYTCVGDTVNLAARLESHTKELERSILIDENTLDGLDDAIEAQPEGELMLKGKNNPVKVFSVA